MELKTEGGMAGCFIVVWKSAERVIEPLIEGIMAGNYTEEGRAKKDILKGEY